MSKSTLDKQVRYCLQVFADTRNSDIELTKRIWIVYYPTALSKSATGQFYVALDKLADLPREDNVKRIRAKIQNTEKLYLPTDAKVAKARGWEVTEWRKYLGYASLGEYL